MTFDNYGAKKQDILPNGHLIESPKVNKSRKIKQARQHLKVPIIVRAAMMLSRIHHYSS